MTTGRAGAAGGPGPGAVRTYPEANVPRLSCPEHGVITAAVPWARHGAAHPRFLDDQVAWLAAACPETTITALMRISWRTAGVIIARVAAEAEAARDRFAGLRRIGIDETACKRGHKYLVIVVNHDTGLRHIVISGQAVCKTVGLAYAGSNPAPATTCEDSP